MEDWQLGFIKIPAGFILNLASIPESLKPIIGHETDPRFLIAGFVHDWLYNIECKLPLTRGECDVLFYYLLVEYGTNEILAQSMYWIVTLFGKSHYKAKSYKNIEAYK